jgi:hypothetical protein
MAARSEDLLFEHRWIEEFSAFAGKAAERSVYVRMSSPVCFFVATGFRPELDDERVVILLQREPVSGLADGVLQFFLPAEENSQYLKRETDDGEIALSIRYPYCDFHPPQYHRWAEFHVATSEDALAVAATDSSVQ